MGEKQVLPTKNDWLSHRGGGFLGFLKINS
jgi:hypothetical protein